MNSVLYILVYFILGAAVGIVAACSPTKFNVVTPDYCIDERSCINEDGIARLSQSYKVGSGKVDILFVNDNSASMSAVQSKLATRFSGFIENLNSKDIDYQIGITTTDANFFRSNRLIQFDNSNYILRKSDSSKVQLFNKAIVRVETAECENFIKSSYYMYKDGFNSTDYYISNYSKYCPSNDERGIYAAYEVISSNFQSLIRDDAHLNIILISNEDVRSGLYISNSKYALEENDKASNFISMMNNKYPSKYWQFNSIIVKDNHCSVQEQNSFYDRDGNPIKDLNGNYIVQANIGNEYAALSASASKDIDGHAVPRGQILNICSNDYSAYFSNIAAKISDSSRMLTLKCKPIEQPMITKKSGAVADIPYVWNGDTQIIFNKGSEGMELDISYKCYSGVK
jgi:hypothetical protein